MNTLEITSANSATVLRLLQSTPFFASMNADQLTTLMRHCEIRSYEQGEALAWKTSSPETFFIILKGEVEVKSGDGAAGQEVVRLSKGEVVGEIGLLLNQPRVGDVTALAPTQVISCPKRIFQLLLDKYPSFGSELSRLLAARLIRNSEARPARAAAEGEADVLFRATGTPPPGLPDLDALLSRAVDARASDVHLSAGHRAYWRIDGFMRPMDGTPVLDRSAVLFMFDGRIESSVAEDFLRTHDVDFAYDVPDVGRFRVNLFRDAGGVGAVLRHIPSEIKTIHQLGLPDMVRQFCTRHKGLVLVTGPTGSGKSTTLAAMVDHLNRNIEGHIITLEDPIEFLHRSDKCLVNQREVGHHTESFARAIKAALREDPDILLVGELRDLETVRLALEAANTGHFVMATLHTSTAVSTIDRVVDVFPPEQQNQVRTSLAECLVGVVSQTLCKHREMGRIAAVELLVVNAAAANLIRTNKTHQLPSFMQAGSSQGHRMLNDELARLVKHNAISKEEAMRCSLERAELAGMIGVQWD